MGVSSLLQQQNSTGGGPKGKPTSNVEKEEKGRSPAELLENQPTTAQDRASSETTLPKGRYSGLLTLNSTLEANRIQCSGASRGGPTDLQSRRWSERWKEAPAKNPGHGSQSVFVPSVGNQSAAVDPSPPSNERTWSVWSLSLRKTRKMLFPVVCRLTQCLFCLSDKSYPIYNRSLSTPNSTNDERGCETLEKASPRRMRFRVHIHSARQWDWSCPVRWFSRIIRRVQRIFLRE